MPPEYCNFTYKSSTNKSGCPTGMYYSQSMGATTKERFIVSGIKTKRPGDSKKWSVINKINDK